MAPVLMEKPTVTRLATGIITHMPAPADEVKLVVFDAKGNVVSEDSKHSSDGGFVTLNFKANLIDKAGTEPYVLLVKGFTKEALAWEQRLGNFHFHV